MEKSTFSCMLFFYYLLVCFCATHITFILLLLLCITVLLIFDEALIKMCWERMDVINDQKTKRTLHIGQMSLKVRFELLGIGEALSTLEWTMQDTHFSWNKSKIITGIINWPFLVQGYVNSPQKQIPIPKGSSHLGLGQGFPTLMQTKQKKRMGGGEEVLQSPKNIT